MSNTPEPQKPAPSAGKLKPVTAIHKVVYGDDKVAVGDETFMPTSVQEAADLVALKAVREPTTAELAAFTKAAV